MWCNYDYIFVRILLVYVKVFLKFCLRRVMCFDMFYDVKLIVIDCEDVYSWLVLDIFIIKWEVFIFLNVFNCVKNRIGLMVDD